MRDYYVVEKFNQVNPPITPAFATSMEFTFSYGYTMQLLGNGAENITIKF